MRWKRPFDLAACALAAGVFTPLVAATAAAIRVADRDPALFRQSRVGRHRAPFTVLKLRTMKDGAVTPIGRWLRGSGIDEVLQFVNVARGEMSVVGPRPLTIADIERLGWNGQNTAWRWSIRPGITGPAQLFGTDAATSLALDRAYVDQSDPILDAELVALSFVVNVVGKRRGRALGLALPSRARRLVVAALEGEMG